ncbi:helix-turn-helix transcriptional regulator [Streptococcus castoreus]|uniref:helix-turn-helix transcriptional regulator n=1 Tax=Streptococcus castoreus TaxID=254786 RepID=UPI0004263492|nr:helix-turn-helix transcriptional regulator [Streptococcus castoreus]
MAYILKNRLKELRARDAINQTEMAKLAGVSRQTISLIERNEYTPSIIIALKIATVFNEPVDSVFTLVEVEKENEKETE